MPELLFPRCDEFLLMDAACPSRSPAEGTPEEPRDEGSDGSDEEPAVGRQRHAHPQEVIASADPLLFLRDPLDPEK